MKKLSKLKLKEFHEMDDFEMRNIIGGYGGYGDGTYSSTNTCTVTCTASGETHQIACYGECEPIPGEEGLQCKENGSVTGSIRCGR